MAIITQILNDGPRNHVIKILGVESDTVTINPATMSLGGEYAKETPNDLAIEAYWYMSSGPSVQLLWDATADVLTLTLPAGPAAHDNFNFRDWFGDIPNNSGAGKTGSLIVTATATPAGPWSLILAFKKKYP